MDELITGPMTKNQSILQAFQKYSSQLNHFIRRRVSNAEDAEDIMQDVWFRLISILDTQPVEQISAWLYRVSLNRIIDKQRKQRQLSLENLKTPDETDDLYFTEALFEEIMNPEEEFEKEFFHEIFLRALDALPEKQRRVFVWNELEDMTLQDIADKTGENIKTIISRKRYAVKRLKKMLQNFKTE